MSLTQRTPIEKPAFASPSQTSRETALLSRCASPHHLPRISSFSFPNLRSQDTFVCGHRGMLSYYDCIRTIRTIPHLMLSLPLPISSSFPLPLVSQVKSNAFQKYFSQPPNGVIRPGESTRITGRTHGSRFTVHNMKTLAETCGLEHVTKPCQ